MSPIGKLSLQLTKHAESVSEWRWYALSETFYSFEGFRSNQFINLVRLTFWQLRQTDYQLRPIDIRRYSLVQFTDRLMRVSRQTVVLVFGDVMMRLARCVSGINVYCGIEKILQVMQELVPHFTSDVVPLLD